MLQKFFLRRVRVLTLGLCSAIIVFGFYVFGGSKFQLESTISGMSTPELAHAQEGDKTTVKPAGKGGENYPTQGLMSGVWNGGQAIFWDLHIIDHFRYFGAEERARGYRPEQPIPFSHVTHVQQNQMECQYCHWSVTKSTYAAIPEVETCMGCHKYVLGRTDEQKQAITKLQTYWDNSGEPYPENGQKTGVGAQIPWEKVHAMPNYIKFSHKRHVKAGVSCHSCHGQVPEMEVVERVSSMKMGWCIDCHRQQGSSIDCATCHY